MSKETTATATATHTHLHVYDTRNEQFCTWYEKYSSENSQHGARVQLEWKRYTAFLLAHCFKTTNEKSRKDEARDYNGRA